ncbi:NusG domain II-containing protein [Syntrophomonas wolfei]|uniref:Uncharacterized protein n=1 Tax=Syntrophomonas wolfei subsp. wolfei (strain DSM 2245B / Goettingen) TaxID=335541 RepID=Q0AVK3_SYNWW|nr:NusG domain II-containing protein [Syntrophomonas wolfei]ABI69251.1 conserved hypothetical protein [Syntrophomonas wolfei subsp. wolfei str. Goettingen G311]
MNKANKILIGVVLALVLFSYWGFFLAYRENVPLTAVISVNGDIVVQLKLDESISKHFIKVPGPLGTSVVEVKPGAIRMKSSPCPGHYCTKTGWIDRPGQVVACIPNRVIIKISPDKESLDAISH